MLAGQVGEDIRKERNTDPLSITSCHVCEMALTFFLVPFYRRPVSDRTWQRGWRVGMSATNDFCKVGHHWCATFVRRPGQASHLPPPTAVSVPSGLWREATLQGTRRARRGALPAGSTALASAHQRQLGVVVRRKCFQTIPAGGEKSKKLAILISVFILSPSWLSRNSSRMFCQYLTLSLKERILLVARQVLAPAKAMF